MTAAETQGATEALTNDMVSALRRDAGSAGDTVQIELCDLALDGDISARAACAQAINSARALDDAIPFVRVISD